MSYVVGQMVATLHPDGRREVTTSDLRVVDGDKPRTLEASGSDPAVWARIRAGEPGTYETLAHVGGATALLVPRRAIALPDPDFLGQMAANFGELGDTALLGAVRTGVSAAMQFCVDTTGAMATTLDLEHDTLVAIPKILVFKSDGWVRMVLPYGMGGPQIALNDAQRKRWEVARPGFAQAHEVTLASVPMGYDLWNGRSTLVVFGPLGDVQYINLARLEPPDEDYRFCDGEWRLGWRVVNQHRHEPEEELVPAFWPLHRQIVAITTVAKHPGVPLILQLHQDGHLHQGGLHVFLDGALNQRLLSHNPARVLGPHGLGWMK